MKKCPNCGQATARTEDWACQWCGYPLLDKSYKKIPKTFKQLKEEEPHEQTSSATEETEVSLLFDHGPLPPTDTAKPEQVLEPEPEQVSEAEQKPTPEPKQVPEAEQKPTPEPEQVPEAEQKPVPEPLPPAKEITVAELISAYEADEAAADAEFLNKPLQLTGVVTKIEVNDTLDIHYIILTSAEEKEPQSVRCVFSKKYGPELNQLAKEQTMTVQGKYNGSIIAMRMRDCVLVD